MCRTVGIGIDIGVILRYGGIRHRLHSLSDVHPPALAAVKHAVRSVRIIAVVNMTDAYRQTVARGRGVRMNKYQGPGIVVYFSHSGASRRLGMEAPVILQTLGVPVFHHYAGSIIRSGAVVIIYGMSRGRSAAYVLIDQAQHKTEV